MAARAPRASGDFETKSVAELKVVGGWRYAEHPSTEVMCMSWHMPDWPRDRAALWHPAYPEYGMDMLDEGLDELLAWVAAGGLFEAHNAAFERAVWRRICVPRLGWPDLDDSQWRCSAAKAARFALPRALDDLARVLRVPQRKDPDGRKMIQRLTKPRNLSKRELRAWLADSGLDPAIGDMRKPEREAALRRVGWLDAQPVHWNGSAAEYARFFDYCRQDVRTEVACSDALPDLSERETRIFLADQAINERGVAIDVPAVRTAIRMVDDAIDPLIAAIPELTGGLVERPTQRARILSWVNEQDVPLMDTQGPTVDAVLLRGDLDPRVRSVLEACRAANRTSTAKYRSMSERTSEHDGRCRGIVIYHGSSTGRWTGVGFQPHNLTKGEIKDMDLAWRVLSTGDAELIELLYGDMMETLSHAIRGALVAPPGRVLNVADFAAIETAVLFWLVGDEDVLQVLRAKGDMYCVLATEIYGYPVNKDDHPNERQLGKQAILGLGFGMGGPKFVVTCAKYSIVITEEFAKYVVTAYRAKFPKVKAFWRAMEECAIAAVESPGRTVRVNEHICFKQVGRFLHMRLPSGKTLAYCDPRVIDGFTPWDAPCKKLTFMAVDALTKQWTRQETYGGALTENAVQATARELLADAIVRVEETEGYDVVFHVHDEVVAESDEGFGTVEAFNRLVSVTEPWADGCPVRAEGHQWVRYRK